ncbi:MAG: phosphoadenylyl-sulfate reductase [Beijerinckiaceae bacterium]|nr:phosphoadenylyl-sulfate reductase [Beijerinckiaceae bacterium]
MVTHEPALFGDSESASRLAAIFAEMDPSALVRLAIEGLFPGRVALISSFGADSAVLLHMAARVDKAAPVIFIDTRVLFPETLAYRDELVRRLGLTNVTTVWPSSEVLAKEDPENFLWAADPDRCCEIRKVLPLAQALEGYDAWISGRKRYQTETRNGLALFESEGGRIKVNPLAHWTAREIVSYLDAHDLPRHPLVAKGFPSIGCIPCTSPVKPGEDPRAGRWRGRAKAECGLHTLPLYAGADI